MECDVASRYWKGRVPHAVVNLSSYGAWIDTPFPLSEGDKAILSLRPPGWTKPDPLILLSHVVRVELRARSPEGRAPGMGVEFLDIQPEERTALENTLRGLPPPAPETL
jgi:hypothetical protein